MMYYNNLDDTKRAIDRIIERDGKEKNEFIGEIITLPEDPLPLKIEMVKVHIDDYGYFLTSLGIWNELKNYLNGTVKES